MKTKIALVFLLLISISFAHLEGEGRIVGDYKMELSTLPPVAESGKNSDIILAIENATTGERLAGVPVWIGISMNDTSVFSTSDLVTDKFGVVNINYVFPGGGQYAVDVSLQEAAASFDVYVFGGLVPLYTAAVAALFFIIGIAIGLIFSRRLRK